MEPTAPTDPFLTRLGGVVVSPARQLARVYRGHGGQTGDVLWLMVLAVALQRPTAVARAALSAQVSVVGALSQLASLVVSTAGPTFVALFVLAMGLQVSLRRTGKTRSFEEMLSVVGYAWVPHGVLLALSSLLVAAGVSGWWLPTEPLTMAEQMGGALALVAKFLISFGWSAVVLALGLRRALSDEADGGPPAAARMAGVGVAALLSLALIGNGVTMVQRSDELRPKRHGDPAPAFRLRTVVNASEDTIALDDLRGRVVLVDFWATWCPSCVEMLPVLEEIRRTYADRGVDVLAITSERGEERAVRAFIEKGGYGFTVLMDTGRTSSLYRVSVLPSSFIVGRDGTLAWVHFGRASASSLREALDEALAGAP